MGHKRCCHCGLSHPSTYHTEKYNTDEGFPIYQSKRAYKRADEQEKVEPKTLTASPKKDKVTQK